MVACGVCRQATGLEERRGGNLVTEKGKVGKNGKWVEYRDQWSWEEGGERMMY